MAPECMSQAIMLNFRNLRSSLVLPALLGAAALSSAQSFGNAGFETPDVAPGQFRSGVDTPLFMSPWFGEHSFGIADGSGSWGTGAHSGSQYAYIQSTNEFGGAGALYQTLTGLTVGGQYSVSFWMARRNGNVGGNTGNVISVFADSTPIFAPTLASNPAWQQFTTSIFTATSSSVKIKFQGQVPGGDTAALLDDVTLNVEAVPEPTTLSVLGLGAFGLMRRRSRTRA